MTRRPLVLPAMLSLVAAALPVVAQPDRSKPPELGPPPALNLPEIERFELENGLPVYLMEKPQVPLAELRLLVRTGSVDDPVGKAGLASMAADMLDEGAGGRDALELADAIEFLGAELDTWSSEHTLGVRLFTPTSNLDEALPLMADVALRPDFPPAELDRLRAEALTRLLQARDEPRAIASVAFGELLFGADHPYGRSRDEASLRAIEVADLAAFHRERATPDNAALIVVGAVTRAGIEPRLEAAFGDWKGTAKAGTEVPFPVQVEGRRIVLVDKPGAAQSEIRIGRVGVSRSHPDYYPIVVMNTVLGGSFTSRLNDNLREQNGYTYGARSGFDMQPVPGRFQAGAAVQTDKTAPAVTEFMKELDDIREISDVEVERARNYRALRFPGSFQSVSGVASQLSELVVHELPLDTFDHEVERLLAVDRAAAERVATEQVDTENLLVLVVGDRAVVGDEVEALGLGPMEVLSIDDVLGPAPKLGD